MLFLDGRRSSKAADAFGASGCGLRPPSSFFNSTHTVLFLRPKEYQMNAPYELANSLARSICGMPPTVTSAMEVLDAHRRIRARRPHYYNVTFKGLDLYVGIAESGDLISVEAGSDGTDVTEIFMDWSDEILKAIDMQQAQEQAA
jgi:hypothetical protein